LVSVSSTTGMIVVVFVVVVGASSHCPAKNLVALSLSE